MRDGDVPRLVGMLVLAVVALATNALPALGFESLDDLGTAHIVYLYTL